MDPRWRVCRCASTGIWPNALATGTVKPINVREHHEQSARLAGAFQTLKQPGRRLALRRLQACVRALYPFAHLFFHYSSSHRIDIIAFSGFHIGLGFSRLMIRRLLIHRFSLSTTSKARHHSSRSDKPIIMA
jgi:hypothetical protein